MVQTHGEVTPGNPEQSSARRFCFLLACAEAALSFFGCTASPTSPHGERSDGAVVPEMGEGAVGVSMAGTAGARAFSPGGGGGGAGLGGAGGAGLGGASGAGPRDEVAPCGEVPAFFITGVVDHAFGSGQNVGQADFPKALLGPPRGAGQAAGSADVVSLGDGGWVVVEFSGNVIVDGPGTDLLVFENPFLVGGDAHNPYVEIGEVSVSQDGHHWLTFACQRREYPYGLCAGWHPVLATAEDSAELARDPALAGGDPFDLADVGLEWARYVRVIDVKDGANQVFDLDAMAIVHSGCGSAPK